MTLYSLITAYLAAKASGYSGMADAYTAVIDKKVNLFAPYILYGALALFLILEFSK